MGPAGGYVMNQGTSMSHTDPVNAWNSWTGTSKLSVGTTGCGVVRSCAIYAWEGATIWGTSCVVPSTGSAWALAFISADSYTNLPSGCDLGTTTYPVFVIAVDSSISFTEVQKQHIRLHELGHALRLGDTTVSCWFDVVWWPLLKNNSTSCSAFPQNATATANEAQAAKDWNGW
jgi:hypothetical protein